MGRVRRLRRWPFVLAGAAGALALGTISGAAANSTVQIVATGTSCTSAFCFVPSSLNGNSGDTVTWSNTTTAPHTVTRCDPSNCSGQGPGTGADTLDSGGSIAASGGTFQHTFHGAGTYFYYCAIHGYSVMHGEVTIASAPSTSVPESPFPAGIALGSAALVVALSLLWRRRRA